MKYFYVIYGVLRKKTKDWEEKIKEKWEEIGKKKKESIPLTCYCAFVRCCFFVFWWPNL